MNVLTAYRQSGGAWYELAQNFVSVGLVFFFLIQIVNRKFLWLVLCICFTWAKSSIVIVTEDFGSPVAYYWNDLIAVEASANAEVNMCGLLWEAKS